MGKLVQFIKKRERIMPEAEVYFNLSIDVRGIKEELELPLIRTEFNRLISHLDNEIENKKDFFCGETIDGRHFCLNLNFVRLVESSEEVYLEDLPHPYKESYYHIKLDGREILDFVYSNTFHMADLLYNLDSLNNNYPRHKFYMFDDNEHNGLMHFINFKDIVYIELDNETYKDSYKEFESEMGFEPSEDEN